jgi:hypothetical protein
MEEENSAQSSSGNDKKELDQIQIRALIKKTPPSEIVKQVKSMNEVNMIHTPLRKGQKRGPEDSLHTMSIDMYDKLMDMFTLLSGEIK